MWQVPESCYAVVETLDPQNQRITEPELVNFTQLMIQAAGTRFGHYNLGAPLCRILGIQVAKRLPNMPLGKGKHREIARMGWAQALLNKSRNRKYVRTSPTP